MPTKRLLVDAIHPEETRIVVTSGNRLEEFDFESATRRQLRGNIYLAKVTRVEPSLQAAFVEYGGNRHGFLAFSEIHPDYYQIPVADREALIRAQEEADEEDEHRADAAAASRSRRNAAASQPTESVSERVAASREEESDEDSREHQEHDESHEDEPGAEAVPQDENAPTEAAAEADPQSVDPEQDSHSEDPVEGLPDVTAESEEDESHEGETPADEHAESDHADDEGAEADGHSDTSHIEEAPAETEPVESIGGGGDALEEARRKPSMSRRNQYKIQEVIKRRQVMLVQVVKEERGNKGAALTTYLSLAGRYSVLMPNTARGGGISRKITNAADRKRLKEIVGDLEVPPGQGIILRTAGASRTKAEVKRDFEYLQRLWENVRNLTLKSTAPCVVYEEGSLIKRTIRDLYSKEIDEVWVAGEDAFSEAKDFMRMIMPSHAKNVQLYRDDQPVFSKYGVENQLDQMFNPTVTLPSGGYLVINPTEALVSIDVNSGRSTKEHNIEDTALQTNLEAAEEVARQLRLRDLAGLIVIDFIDMMENRSNRAVERKLKDCLKNDRARIQVGRISHFGLMEMSRQRIRFGVVESSTHKCPVCQGTGIVRSVESVALMVMRAVEDHVLRKPGQSINVKVPTDVALYILNTKRSTLNALEAKYDLSITIVADDHINGTHYLIERGEARLDRYANDQGTHVRVDTAAMADEVVDADAEVEDEDEEESSESTEARSTGDGEGADRQGRRRRRRGRGRDREREPGAAQPSESRFGQQAAGEGESVAEGDGDDEETGEPQAAGQPNARDGAPRGDNSDETRRRRRRGRRGGRRNRRPEDGTEPVIGAQGDADAGTTEDEILPAVAAEETEVAEGTEVTEGIAATVLAQNAIAEAAEITPPSESEARPRRARRVRRTDDAAPAAAEDVPAVTEDASVDEARPRPRRRAKAAPPTDAEAVQSAEALANLTSGRDVPEPVDASADGRDSEPAPEATATDDAAEQTSRRPRKELPEGEIVVSSTAQAEGEAKPKRAGWWQRVLR